MAIIRSHSHGWPETRAKMLPAFEIRRAMQPFHPSAGAEIRMFAEGRKWSVVCIESQMDALGHQRIGDIWVASMISTSKEERKKVKKAGKN